MMAPCAVLPSIRYRHGPIATECIGTKPHSQPTEASGDPAGDGSKSLKPWEKTHICIHG
jgi:hypothetical protein